MHDQLLTGTGKPLTMGHATPDEGQASLIRELVDLHHFTENILRSMGSGLIATNGQGVITHFNERAASITGWPVREALGLAGALVFRVGEGDLFTDAPTSGTREGEVDLLTRDDRLVPVSLRVTRLAIEESMPAGVVAIFDDLTELKRSESELRRKERLASLGELSAGVAHEIRNPLAGIGAAAQLLKKRLGEREDMIRLADIILDESARLDRIVESLLKFGRPAPPHLLAGSVLDCIRRVLALVEEKAGEAGVIFDIRTDPEIPDVYIDTDQIVQVFLNLVQNALQAMPDGGTLSVAVGVTATSPWVRRTAGRRVSDRGQLPAPTRTAGFVEIRIGDTGPGIPRAILERIFDPFFTTRREGTGLGLSICQAIIREHAGLVQVESIVNRGTTAIVTLPLEKRRGPRRRN
ncbi:MAG: ATP-binding protein [Candidatus Eisenbacteria bacterium]|nr:ATP-binding protein [Candidatus Eisenbacteria bacterium]